MTDDTIRLETLEQQVRATLQGQSLARWKSGANPIPGTDGSIHIVEVHRGEGGNLTVKLREFLATTPSQVERALPEAWDLGYGVAVEKENDDPSFGETVLVRPPSGEANPLAVSGVCDWVLAEPGDYEEDKAEALLRERGEPINEVSLGRLAEELRSERVIHVKIKAILEFLSAQLARKGISTT